MNCRAHASCATRFAGPVSILTDADRNRRECAEAPFPQLALVTVTVTVTVAAGLSRPVLAVMVRV